MDLLASAGVAGIHRSYPCCCFWGEGPPALRSRSTEAWLRWVGLGLTRMGNAPRPEGLRRVVRGAEPGAGMKTFDWPVKLSRSVGEWLRLFERLGVASSSSVEELLRRDPAKRCKGR